MMRSGGMSSHCVVPFWNNNNNQRQEQQQVEGDLLIHHHHHQQQQQQQRNNNLSIISNTTPNTTTSTSNAIPISKNNNYEQQVKELKWENGNIAMNGLISSTKPVWAQTGGTLESVVHQATQQGPITTFVGSDNKKRVRSESEELGRPKNPITRPSASADTTMLTWASFDSPPSLKNKTTDEDSTSHGCLENQDEERNTKGESGRSNSSRRSRAAAVHNQSERRRRDRINQKMKALQKLVPNSSKTDKASMLDEVIEYLKQLQGQVQVMSSIRATPSLAPPMMMMPLGMQQMSLLAAASRMGMGMGMGMIDMGTPNTFVQSPFMMVPPQSQHQSQAQPRPNVGPSMSSLPLPDPYCTLLAQSMNMEMYNKMAAAMYTQQHLGQTTQSTPSRSTRMQAD